jgi:hypothetical protein
LRQPIKFAEIAPMKEVVSWRLATR